MTALADRFAALQPEKLALAVREATDRLDAFPAEPVAIVGMGCRFPGGADSPAAFWDLLEGGRSAVTEVPPARWDVDAYYDPRPGTPGKMYTRHGAFLDAVDAFDAELFRISPREAVGMDPQQRLLLETTWTAMDDAAALGPDATSDVGVFVGIMHHDYAQLLAGIDSSDGHTGSGNGMSVAAGRIAHTFGFRGPTLALDTACSSSLVALHLACRALQGRECATAVAGGVNLMLSPASTVVESQMRMLAPDGRCKTFDARADGFVRGEACGVVVLKRLSDALRDGDRVHALVRGTAVNHDGHSAGLTVPNGAAQERVIRRALADGGVQPAQVGYVEAHGTGTALGDPIELAALGRVYGEGRDHDLVVGSVKTNIGHTESAAGIAGVFKAVLALQQATIPPHLNLQTPSDQIAWDQLAVRIPLRSEPWPGAPGRRLAGVSSFGFSGTNAHVVLEGAPPCPDAPADVAGPHLVTVSSTTADGLRDAAADMADRLDAGDPAAPTLAQLATATQKRRGHLRHRAAVTATTAAEAALRLRAVAEGAQAEAGTAIGAARGEQPRVAFLFTGNGSHYPGMGAALRAAHPEAEDVMRRCADVAAGVLPHPLLEVVDGRGGEGLLDRIEYAQPALYALQCALVAVWRGWGIEPAAVAGHSMGEYAAAQAAGVFDLADGMRLALERGTRLAALPEGGMRVCFAAVSAVSAALDDLPGVTIAAINAPRNVVVAGSPQDLQRAAEVLADHGIESRPLTVDHAYHSPHTDAVLDGFHRAAATFTYAKPQLPFVSSVTGGHVDVELTGADYWTRHIRQPVRFAGAVQTLLDAGVDAFVEIGPKAALVGLARASAAEHRVATPPAFTACLREAGADARTMRDAAGVLATSGSVLRWDRIGPGGSPFADLPPHAFQRQAFWLGQSPAGGNGSVAAARGPAADRHPLLGARLRLAGAERRYEVEVAAHRPAYLRDHQVAGAVVLPGAALVEMLLVAAREQAPAMPLDLGDVALRRPVVLPETGLRTLQTHVAAGSAEIFSLGEDGQWASVAAAALGDRGPAAAPPPSLREIGGGAQGTTSLQAFDVEAYYDHYLAGGLAYGPDFRSITHLAARPGSSEADLGLPPGVDGGDHLLHPVLLDGALQAIGAGLPEGDTRVWVPAGIGRVHLVQPAATTARARIAVSGDPSGDVLHADIVLTDVDGDLIAMLRDVRLAPAGTGALGGASTPDVRRWLYAVDHRPAVRRRPPAALRLPAPAQVRDGLQAQLAALRDRDDLVRHGAALARLDAMVPPLVASAVERLGWVEDQTISTAEELRGRLGVHDRHRRLWPRLLGHLADAGGLVRTDAGYAVDAAGMAGLRARRAAGGDAADVVTGAPAEAAILRRCGDGLAEVLTGQADPLQLLFGDGDAGSPAALYARSAGYRAMNRLVRTAVADLVADLAPGAGVRILEVGGGTGGTTAHVLPILPAEATEYVFTDISPHFLSRARTLFAAHPFLRTDLLDIAEDPQLQGQHAGRYDLIIAANVLHATPDLRRSLGHVHSLLAPGGRLVLVEALVARPWLELTFGLTDGWWAYEDDDLRGDTPLVDLPTWTATLEAAGFDQVLALTEDGAEEHVDAAVLLAGTPLAAPPSPAGARGRRVLLLGADTGLGERLSALALARGHECTTVSQDEEDWPAALRTAAPDVIVDLWGTNPTGATTAPAPTPASAAAPAADLGEAVDAVTDRALALLPALRDPAPGMSPSWVVVTRGAHGPTDRTGDARGALAWGLVRAIAEEVGDLVCRAVDLDPGVPIDAQLLLEEALAAEETASVVYRDGVRLGPELHRWSPPEATVAGRAPELRADGCYLITGGFGGLGLVTARWAVRRGAAHLVLVGRSDPSPDAHRVIDRLRAGGAAVHVVAGDVGIAADVLRLREVIAALDVPLRGIVHAAGGLADGMLHTIDRTRFQAPLGAKVIGSALLADLARDAHVDLFVLYSSAVALLGGGGQANHIVACAFQDQLAHQLRAEGVPAVSLNWGAWSAVGAAADPDVLARMAARGLGALTPDDGTAALDLVLQDPPAQVAVIPVDWASIVARPGSEALHPLLQPLVAAEREATSSGAATGRDDALLQALGRMTHEEVQGALVGYVLATLGRVLGRSLAAEDATRPLHELGLDSLIAIDLRNRMLVEVEVDVAIERLVGGGTPADVAGDLGQTLLLTAPGTDEDPEGYEELTL